MVTIYKKTEVVQFGEMIQQFKIVSPVKVLDMIEEAKRRFPEINIIDDNHADALALLELAKSDLK